MLLSIIVPCYNAENYLSIFFHELELQDLNDCEVIFINDGSNDETERILKNYIYKKDNYYVYTTVNKGVSSARNLGIVKAKGEYIDFLDVDDCYVVNGIKNIKEDIKNSEADILTYGFIKRRNDKNLIISNKSSSGVYERNEFLRLFLMRQVHFLVGAFICKKSILIGNDIKFNEKLKIGEDFDLFFNTIKNAQKIKYSSVPIFYYNINASSAMQGYVKYSIEVFNSFINNYKNANCLKVNNSNFINECNFFIKNSYVAHLIMYLKSMTRNIEINKCFLEYRYLIKLKSKQSFVKSAIFLCIRLIPLQLLFFIFHKK